MRITPSNRWLDIRHPELPKKGWSTWIICLIFSNRSLSPNEILPRIQYIKEIKVALWQSASACCKLRHHWGTREAWWIVLEPHLRTFFICLTYFKIEILWFKPVLFALRWSLASVIVTCPRKPMYSRQQKTLGTGVQTQNLFVWARVFSSRLCLTHSNYQLIHSSECQLSTCILSPQLSVSVEQQLLW